MENTLKYSTDYNKGYHRIRKGKGYQYLDEKDKPVKQQADLDRIQKLVIPPAWQEVWISPFENGHLQVTGIDEKGRKQYIYHPDWTKLRQESKFDRMLEFGKVLPKIRRQLKKDLRRRKLVKEKVVAIALNIMEDTLIRAGNMHYRKTYQSYGLTTLTDRQVKIKGQRIFFKFKGKKGVLHEIKLSDRQIARQLRDVMEIPGHELFQYYNSKGEIAMLDSGDLNTYIRETSGENFTSKDYRTWAGTALAFRFLSEVEAFDTKKACQKNIVACLDHVAKKLGNTRTVCRQYYVHSGLIEAYENGEIQPYLKKLLQKEEDKDTWVEKYLLQYLKKKTNMNT